MQLPIILLCLACTVFASLEEDREQWVNFKNKHDKIYKNLQEEKYRFSVFQQNLRSIEDHNKQFKARNTTYTQGVNRFADRTREELLAMLKKQSASRSHLETHSIYKRPEGLRVPDSIDWRDYGAVSAIKDQEGCGSCWAFSVTGTLEGFYYLKNNRMLLFSEQQLVDCSMDDGCDGGDEWPTLKYVQENGIQTEDTYPYEGVLGSCRYNHDAIALQTNGYIRLETKNEWDLLNAVGTLGPISVALDASTLFFYSGGVFTDSNCSQDGLTHAVLAVGYGHDQDSGMDYWIIKNSWSENWGDKGYFKIRRGTNECGIATDCCYPVL